MNHTYEMTGFNFVKQQLEGYANTVQAKAMAAALEPYMAEIDLRKHLRDTTQARQMIERFGTPPVPRMENIESFLDKAVIGELLGPEDIEAVGSFLGAAGRLNSYLSRGRESQIGLAFYADNLKVPGELREEIERCIRGGQVDDYASGALRDIRRRRTLLESEIREKAERVLSANKAYMADGFVVNRGGHICVPLKRTYKSRVEGSVIDTSATGATLFVEPKAVTAVWNACDMCRIEEDEEERRILYTLMDQIAENEALIREDIRVIVFLDFVFAKGKMSLDMGGVEPLINLERRILLKGARHPMLNRDRCVPLDFELGRGIRGIVITGPNTGGKTVAIKTVALMSLMACAGLHVPCEGADIAMNAQVLCDIGDGQNISDNLSTFSAHIKNIIDIVKRVNDESLVILDEMGSGTDPAEGMGLAIAILDRLKKSGCLFLATTHYPEVKEYTERCDAVINARMAFDRESLQPLYRLEIGKSGESCALYIAKRLGLPEDMLAVAAKEARGKAAGVTAKGGCGVAADLDPGAAKDDSRNSDVRNPGSPKSGPRILRAPKQGMLQDNIGGFSRGDSVVVMPENVIGIVVKPADSRGDVLVQVKKEKKFINHRRLKLKVAARELYPEDYDFSIIFDTVENRKARHKMEKGYQENLSIEIESVKRKV